MEKQVQEVRSTDGMKSVQRTAQQGRHPRKRINKKLWWGIGIAIVILGIGAGGYLFLNRSQIDSSKYQAVFLTNGQVYFGKLHDYYTDRPYVTEVYYIQAPSDGNTASTDTNQQLVKLGSEVHAPHDTLILNKPSILFVENLTDDGKVAQLIEQSKNEAK